MLFCTCLKILGILEFRTFGKSPNLFNSLALKPETLCKLKEKNVRLQFSAPELQYSIHLYLKAVVKSFASKCQNIEPQLALL